ncbi:MAG: hypothetical protein HRK26_02885 [Rickettsiaceae bacterium H1]|nr:hypothetical protein [Rickettsiaceae bacterium H1]
MLSNKPRIIVGITPDVTLKKNIKQLRELTDRLAHTDQKIEEQTKFLIDLRNKLKEKQSLSKEQLKFLGARNDQAWFSDQLEKMTEDEIKLSIITDQESQAVKNIASKLNSELNKNETTATKDDVAKSLSDMSDKDIESIIADENINLLPMTDDEVESLIAKKLYYQVKQEDIVKIQKNRFKPPIADESTRILMTIRRKLQQKQIKSLQEEIKLSLDDSNLKNKDQATLIVINTDGKTLTVPPLHEEATRVVAKTDAETVILCVNYDKKPITDQQQESLSEEIINTLKQHKNLSIFDITQAGSTTTSHITTEGIFDWRIIYNDLFLSVQNNKTYKSEIQRILTLYDELYEKEEYDNTKLKRPKETGEFRTLLTKLKCDWCHTSNAEMVVSNEAAAHTFCKRFTMPEALENNKDESMAPYLKVKKLTKGMLVRAKKIADLTKKELNPDQEKKFSCLLKELGFYQGNTAESSQQLNTAVYNFCAQFMPEVCRYHMTIEKHEHGFQIKKFAFTESMLKQAEKLNELKKQKVSESMESVTQEQLQSSNRKK